MVTRTKPAFNPYSRTAKQSAPFSLISKDAGLRDLFTPDAVPVRSWLEAAGQHRNWPNHAPQIKRSAAQQGPGRSRNMTRRFEGTGPNTAASRGPRAAGSGIGRGHPPFSEAYRRQSRPRVFALLGGLLKDGGQKLDFPSESPPVVTWVNGHFCPFHGPPMGGGKKLGPPPFFRLFRGPHG